jgi:hypothetical protein
MRNLLRLIAAAGVACAAGLVMSPAYGGQTRPSTGQMFSFQSGVAFGILDRDAEFKPYSIDYVRSVLDTAGEPGCTLTSKLDSDEKLQGCFVRTVERSLKEATSRYEELVSKLQGGELAETLGFGAGLHWWNTPVAAQDIPSYKFGTAVSISSLVSGGISREKLAEKLRAPDKSWSLNSAPLAYGHNIVTPFLRDVPYFSSSGAAIKTSTAAEPNSISVEVFQQFTKLGTVEFADINSDRKVDSVTFYHPYEPVPRFGTPTDRSKCTIYGDGLLPVSGLAAKGKDRSGPDVIRLEQAPSFSVARSRSLSRGAIDSKAMVAIDAYYAGVVETISKLGAKLATTSK